jgi:hypothetical protein
MKQSVLYYLMGFQRIAQEKRIKMMFLRPKSGIFTNALKNHLKWGAFSEFMHNPYPLYVAHDTPSLKIRFSLLFSLKNAAALGLFLSTNP